MGKGYDKKSSGEYMFKLFIVLMLAAFPTEARTVFLRDMEPFSGLSKNAVIQKRTDAVRRSIVFGNADYTPSPAVFQIDDGVPWIGAYEIACNGVEHSPDIGAGASRESLGILNPELLFYASIPSFGFKHRGGYCSSVDYLAPYSADYDAYTQTITVRIDASAFYRKNGYYASVLLSDANARDLGYRYAFASSVSNIRFKDASNLSTRIIGTAGFYHRGRSCGKAGGCNNYSPYERGYHFNVDGVPASLTIKLWKERPSDERKPADMTYRLLFD